MSTEMVRFHDPISTVDRFTRECAEYGDSERTVANRFYALYSQYCWANGYPRQTKSAVLDHISKREVDLVEREVNGTTDLRGEPWTVIEGLSVNGGVRP